MVKVSAYASPQKVLIVNTNGGGHANIGFWLSKTLAGRATPIHVRSTYYFGTTNRSNARSEVPLLFRHASGPHG